MGTKKCPGVNTSIPSSGGGKATRGLEFKQASICARTVVIFIGEPYIAHHSTQVVFEALHRSLPQTAKVWCMFWCELPLNSFGRTEVTERILLSCSAKESMQLLELPCSTYEISSMVTPLN